MQWVVTGFILATVIQLIYWGGLFRRVVRHRPPAVKEVSIPVSVVICAKNEAGNLRKHLPQILMQDYADFEVIVVNDHSQDGTMEVLEDLQRQHSRLRIINLDSEATEHPGKKLALTQGIRNAKNDWLLMTDADCAPASRYWIKHMMQVALTGKKIGLGYAPYRQREGLLNAFIRYETLLTALQYLSWALAGKPYMGVGRNLIYHRSLFDQAGGFEDHKHIASGDDDLFVSSVATGANTMILDYPEAVVYSEPETNLPSWLRQKKRHLSTGTQYDTHTKIFLSLFSISHFFHIIFGFLMLIFNFGTDVAIVGCTLRTLVIVLMCTRFRKKFYEVNEMYWIPVTDYIYAVYYMALGPYLISTKTQSWK